MKSFLRSLVVLGVILAFFPGCSKQQKAMPITQKNVAEYMQGVDKAVKGINPSEYAATKGDEAKHKEMFYRTFIKPMNDLGYDYDKTIHAIAEKVLKREIPATDVQMTRLIGDMIVLGRFTKDGAFKHGYITKETKELLEKIAAAPPAHGGPNG